MRSYFAKEQLTFLQAFVVALWLAQAHAIRWSSLPQFVLMRGRFKTREWYDD